MRYATLNHIYRLVWSDLHQTWVAVSELTRGQGKKVTRKLSAAVVVTASMVAPLAHAGPTGGQITAGSGTINQSGSTTTINQGSQNLSLNWQSFNTSASETVNFSQPSTSAIAVNRIGDQNPTQFLGKLNANGQVYLINPNGIVFGAGAQVNVGGLVASTLDINDSAASGNARTFSGTGAGSVVNKGTINTANGGYVAFVGKQVQNQGTITAPGGAAALAAGSDVTLSFTGDKLVNLQINKSTVDTLAENGGLVQADGGAVWMSAGARDTVLASVVNNTGIVQARSVQNVNGTIVLEAGSAGTTTNDGTLDVAGVAAGQHGGSAKVLGGTVNLTANSRIDASGDTGGGSALIGGNFKGLGSEQRATNTTVAAGSRIEADARSNGNGGQVAVWSDGTTRFDGHISARGGRASGNGGSVETSGKHLTIGSNASVATLAPNGQTGDWLLDPDDFTIYSDGYSTGDMKDSDVTAALQSSNVTIKTGATTTCTGGLSCTGHSGNGDIILAEGVLIGGSNWTSGTTLTLSAYRNIELLRFANVDTSSGTGSVIMRSDNTGTGTGTVLLSNESNIYGNSTGTVQIYYNPSSYTSPTNYAGLTDASGDLLIRMPDASKLSTYMYVNLAAVIGNKTYDGSTAASISSATVRGGVPSDVTVDTSGATATFADKNVGTGKAVTVSGITLSGSGASKYALNGLDSSTATISKRDLSLSGISANNKTYDGTTNATISGSAVVSALGSDVVSVSGSGAGSTFADKNAGTGKAVTVSGYTLTGADAGNYNLVEPTGLTADIAKASISVTGVSAANKTYDGTTAATVVGTATVNAFGSDAVAVSGSGSASFGDKNAGSGKAVTVSGYTLSGADAGNYNLVQPSGLTATIRKASLVLGGVSVSDKVYDGTTAATLSGTGSVSALGSDVVSVQGSGSAVFADKNAGANKAVNVSGYSLSGADAGNYNLVQPSGLTATISKADLLLSGLGISNKVYDGTTAATLTGTGSVSAFGSDVVSLSGSGSANFADKNAGSGKAAIVSGYTLTGADAGNYNLIQPSGLSADIAKANLSVTGVAAANKTYDGTTAANVVGTATVSAFGSDAVAVSGSGSASFGNKNAGAGKAVTVSGYTLSGADAGNYNLVQPSGLTANINKASLVLAGLGVSDKVYDGTTAAILSGTGSVSAIGGDVVSVQGSGSAVFADKNAGANKAVNVSGYSLSGADAGNYNLVQPSGLTASISKADLLLSGLGISSKVYDGTTAATLTGTGSVSAFGSDVVSLAGSGSANFADKNAGSGKAAIVSGFTLTGADAGNYNLVRPTGLTADITKANLSVTGVAAANKTYDGTTAANILGTATVNAFGSDVVTVSGSGSASFGDKNAGSGKAVTVSGYTLSGADAGNYNLFQPSGVTASISKASLVLAGLGVSDKVYDGTTAATLSGTGSVSAFGGDVVSVVGSGSASFADKNAGANKAVNVSGYSLSGADAGNYNLIQPSGLTATISKADLLLSGLGISNKVYDGTTAATLTGTGSVSAFGSDVVSLSGSGSANFADKNAGSGKAAIVSGYTLTGADAGNYNLVQPSGLTADIAKANLSVTGVAAANKTYDGTTAANIVGTATVSAFGSDAVTVSGNGSASFGDKNAGTGKAVTVSGYTLSGADAGNYNLVQPSGLTASISKASLVLAGLGVSDKVYDGTTAATLSGTGSVSAFGSDVVSVTGSGSASFADKNVGANKAVNVSGYSLTGADAGNYNLVQPSGLTATISKADLLLSGLGISNKVYDGTTAATLTGTGSVSAIGSDVVSVAGSGSASFADKNVGNGKAVTVGGYALGGADADNYRLVLPSSFTANITPASLTLSGITASDKVFDGTQRANINTGNAVLTGLLGGDAVSLVSSGAFADAAVGNGKLVTLSNGLTGSDSGNYTLTGQTTTLASITAIPAGPAATIPAATLATTGSLQTTQNAVAQVQSAVLPVQATAQPRALSLSSTLEVRDLQQDNVASNERNGSNGNTAFLNTSIGFGIQAPRLSIQNGGVQLPPVAVSVSQ